jgi:hypothetical protein
MNFSNMTTSSTGIVCASLDGVADGTLSRRRRSVLLPWSIMMERIHDASAIELSYQRG